MRHFICINKIQSKSWESDPCLVVLELYDNCNGLALAQGSFFFFFDFYSYVFNEFIYSQNQNLSKNVLLNR